MRDVMVDIETMGRGHRAAIVSIGAVRFDPVACKVGNDEASKFYTTIDLRDAQHHGQIIDADTVLWWLAQDGRAQAELHGGMGLQIGLIRFASFVGTIRQSRVWGNGSNFDNRILREAYELVDMQCPWHYRDDRDMRTIVGLAKTWDIEIEFEFEFEGTRHHALDDAVYQAQVVCDIYQKIRAQGQSSALKGKAIDPKEYD